MAAFEPTVNNYAKFAQNPRILPGLLKLASGSLNTSTPTNLVELGTLGAGGGILTAASAMPAGACTAVSALLYGSTDNGATKFPLNVSILVPSFSTPGTSKRTVTVSPEVSEAVPIRLPGLMKIYGALEVAIADGIQIIVQVTEFA